MPLLQSPEEHHLTLKGFKSWAFQTNLLQTINQKMWPSPHTASMWFDETYLNTEM